VLVAFDFCDGSYSPPEETSPSFVPDNLNENKGKPGFSNLEKFQTKSRGSG
jgi:hypothetical protein